MMDGCQTIISCEENDCPDFDASLSCQCNADCLKFDNCCEDADICKIEETTELPTMMPTRRMPEETTELPTMMPTRSMPTDTDPCTCPEGTGFDSDTMTCLEGSTTRCWECAEMEGCMTISCNENDCPAFGESFSCQCNDACHEFGDCCEDVEVCTMPGVRFVMKLNIDMAKFTEKKQDIKMAVARTVGVAAEMVRATAAMRRRRSLQDRAETNIEIYIWTYDTDAVSALVSDDSFPREMESALQDELDEPRVRVMQVSEPSIENVSTTEEPDACNAITTPCACVDECGWSSSQDMCVSSTESTTNCIECTSLDMCVEGTSCEDFGCPEVFMPEHTCQCDSMCEEFDNCCEDFEEGVCEMTEDTTMVPDPETTADMATYIGVEEAYEMIENGEFDMIIDVRAFEDRNNNLGYSTYHILGSINVPELGWDLADNQNWASMRDDSCKDMSVLVVCYGGSLAFGATDYLVENGWTNIYASPQGEWGVQYGGWVDAGYETELGEGTSELPCDATEEPVDDGCDCDMSGYVSMDDFDALRAEVRELQGSLGSVEADNNDVMNAMEDMATCMSGIVDGFSGGDDDSDESYDTEAPMTEAPETTTTRMRTTTKEPTMMPTPEPSMKPTMMWETMATMLESGNNKCSTGDDARAFRLTFTSLDKCVERCYQDERCSFASTDMTSWCIGCIELDRYTE